MALKLAVYLTEVGVKDGTLVGVSIPKGINQVIAVYGIIDYSPGINEKRSN